MIEKLNIVPTVPPEEYEICLRLRLIRRLFNLQQSEMARLFGMPKGRFASYEYGRAPLRLGLALAICRRFSINQRWLAEGKKPIGYCVPLDLDFERSLMERRQMLFSSVYHSLLKPRIEKHLADLESTTGLHLEEIDESCEGLDLVPAAGETQLRNLTRGLHWIIGDLAYRLPENLHAEFYQALSKAVKNFANKNKKLLAPVGISPDVEDFLSSDRLPSATPTTLWSQLLIRLRVSTKSKGGQADLARALGISRQAVNKWFTGKGEPSAEIALKALEWVEKAERKGQGKARRGR